MDDLELPVAEVDDVAVFEDARRRGLLHRVAFRAIGLGRQRVEDLVGDVRIGQRVLPRRVCEKIGFGRMHRAALEFVVAADMVEMRVARHRDQVALRDERHPFTQRDDAHAAIDQHVAVAPADMPDIAAIEFLDIGLGNSGHVVVEATNAVPILRADALH